MSRQISFFHAEPDAVRFLQEIDRRGGTFWIGNAAVPPLSMIEAVQDKMSTHLCKFRIVPAGLAAACSASMPEAAIIEFCNCCRGNAMSRTYEVGPPVPCFRLQRRICSGERRTIRALRDISRRPITMSQKREPTFLPPFGKNSVPIIIMLPAQEGPSFSGASETR